jgi:uncharacterized protein YdbL (DUF1318 family)
MSRIAHDSLARRIALGLAASALLVAAPVLAQRDPAYQAARSSGQVGEQTDGYLGVVGSQPQSIHNLVDDLNIKRRANYTQNAQAHSATVEEWAFTQGCILIMNTVPGEKYQAPDGTWATRTSAAPQRSSKCP